MTDCICRRFPEYAEVIRALQQKNHVFREMCDDYEEVSTWLSSYCRSGVGASGECDRAREAMRDLENEINRALRSAGSWGRKPSCFQTKKGTERS